MKVGLYRQATIRWHIVWQMGAPQCEVTAIQLPFSAGLPRSYPWVMCQAISSDPGCHYMGKAPWQRTLGSGLVEHVGGEGVGGGGQRRHDVHALGALLPVLQEGLAVHAPDRPPRVPCAGGALSQSM